MTAAQTVAQMVEATDFFALGFLAALIAIGSIWAVAQIIRLVLDAMRPNV